MEFYWLSGSPFCWRVMLALELKGVAYESKLLEGAKKQQKSPEFLRLNPRGTVPVLRDNDVVVRESMAIMAYLEKKHPTPALFGETPQSTARIWECIADHTERFHPATKRIIRPLFRNKVEQARADLPEAAVLVETELVALDLALTDHTWLAGDTPSAAEAIYYPTLQRLLRAIAKPAATELDLPFALLRERFAHIAAWLDRIAALPGVDRTHPPHWA